MRSVNCSERYYLKLDHPVAMLSDIHIEAPSHVAHCQCWSLDAQRPANTVREVYRGKLTQYSIYLTISSRIFDRGSRHGGKLALVWYSAALNQFSGPQPLDSFSGPALVGTLVCLALRLPVRSTSCSSRTSGMSRTLTRDAAAVHP